MLKIMELRIERPFGHLQVDSAKVQYGLVTLLGITNNKCCFVGIDPGSRNMGIAILHGRKASLYQIELSYRGGAAERVQNIMQVVKEIVGTERVEAACIEQAAYAALYGQTTLAEARTAALVALQQGNTGPIYVETPKHIRLIVFGSGNTRSQELWPDILPDAGSALGCALYALRKHLAHEE